MNRNAILLSLFDSAGLGLEIGPSFNPLLPKRNGHNIEILDHLDTAALIEKYRNAPGVDLSRIESVDYVSTGASIYDAIQHEHRFDFIVASHVIEHTVDLVGFLRDCERLLKTEGTLVLAIPDKRFSFDVFRPLTSTGAVLQAHLEKRVTHPAGAIFDEVAYNALRGGALAWPRDNDDEITFFSNLDAAQSTFLAAQRDDAFRDIHAWQFTPSSFRLIVNDLAEMKYIGLREAQFREGAGEFFVTLSKTAKGTSLSRIELAKRTIQEQSLISTEEALPEASAGSDDKRARGFARIVAILRGLQYK